MTLFLFIEIKIQIRNREHDQEAVEFCMQGSPAKATMSPAQKSRMSASCNAKESKSKDATRGYSFAIRGCFSTNPLHSIHDSRQLKDMRTQWSQTKTMTAKQDINRINGLPTSLGIDLVQACEEGLEGTGAEGRNVPENSPIGLARRTCRVLGRNVFLFRIP